MSWSSWLRPTLNQSWATPVRYVIVKLIFAMSVLNCAGLAWKYKRYWNRKLLSLSSSVLLKVSGMWALVPLELVLGLGVWLALSVLASQPSMSANCSLVLLLQQGFDCEWVEKVGLLAVKLVIVIRRECGQTLGRVRVRKVVINSLQRMESTWLGSHVIESRMV